MVIDKTLNELIEHSRLSISILNKLGDLLTELSGIVSVVTNYEASSISFIIKFDNNRNKNTIPKLSTKYNFDILLLVDKQAIIKFKNQ